MCKVLAHIGIKGNEVADKVIEEATDVPGMASTRLPNTEYNPNIRRPRNSKW